MNLCKKRTISIYNIINRIQSGVKKISVKEEEKIYYIAWIEISNGKKVYSVKGDKESTDKNAFLSAAQQLVFKLYKNNELSQHLLPN